MNLFKLSLSYLKRNLLTTVLNVLLLSFGIATIVILLLFSYQLEENLYKNAEGIDVVVGAKGSPIQLILSGIYHIDNPTGNIDLDEAKQLMAHPMVARAIPLALGDNYQGYRIVGTTTEYLERYRAELSEGTLWDFEFELVLGADVAEQANLGIGDRIVSSHGFTEAGHVHDDHELTVVGILNRTGTVIDRLILTGVETMWGIHRPHDHDHDDDHDHSHDEHVHDHNHDHDHSHEGHDHDHNHNGLDHDHSHEVHGHDHHDHDDGHAQSHTSEGSPHHGHHHTHGRAITDRSFLDERNYGEQITALLISYSNPLAAAQFPRFVNDQTSMQAAAPAIEVTRLLSLLGVGIEAIRLFAYVLIFASILGIFIALLNSMKERRYDLAIMRSLGGSRMKLFSHVVLEGVMISLAGGILGMLLGHVAMEGVGQLFSEAQQFAFTGFVYVSGEEQILLLAAVVGILSSLIPAMMAYRTEIAETLSKS